MSTQATDQRVTIIEEMPASLVTASRRNALLVLVALVAAGCAIHATVIVCLDRHDGFGGVMAMWIAVALIGLASVSVLHHLLTSQIPSIELRGRELAVRYGSRCLVAQINDCHIRLGTAGGMRLAGGVVCFCRVPVILIDLPPWWNPILAIRHRPRDINTIAVGYTNETRVQWENALLEYMASDPKDR